MGEKIIQKLEKHLLKHQVAVLKNLPTLPEVITRINRMVEDERYSVKDVGEFIESDQVLSARMLRLVNSAFYGVSGKVSTVPHALTLLGLDVVKGLLLSTLALDLTDSRLRGLWEHSLGCAVAAGVLAKYKKLLTEINETQNELKTELESALSHHFASKKKP